MVHSVDMKRTYRWDPDQHTLVELYTRPPRAGLTVTTDAYANTPTVSPVDGHVIDSRAALREHNLRNDVVDIGNDSTCHPQTAKSMRQQMQEQMSNPRSAYGRHLTESVMRAWHDAGGR